MHFWVIFIQNSFDVSKTYVLSYGLLDFFLTLSSYLLVEGLGLVADDWRHEMNCVAVIIIH